MTVTRQDLEFSCFSSDSALFSLIAPSSSLHIRQVLTMDDWLAIGSSFNLFVS